MPSPAVILSMKLNQTKRTTELAALGVFAIGGFVNPGISIATVVSLTMMYGAML